jgi:hypothetical protein
MEDILYVGATICVDRRFSQHINSSKTDKKPIYRKIRRLNKLHKSDVHKNIFFQIKLTHVVNSKKELYNIERYYTKKLLKKGVKLYNVINNLYFQCGCGLYYSAANKSKHEKLSHHIQFFDSHTHVLDIETIEKYLINQPIPTPRPYVNPNRIPYGMSIENCS